MINFMLKLFGISSLKEQITELTKECNDLRVTIDSLKSEATDTYKIYQDAFVIILAINSDSNDRKWWETDEAKYSSNQHVRELAYKIERAENIKFAKNNPSLKIRQVFHGGCIGCNTPINNGIVTCTGCQYLMGWDYPNLHSK